MRIWISYTTNRKLAGVRHYWPVVKRKGDASEEQCYLECKRCLSLLCVANISNSVLHHNKGCKKRKLPQQQVQGLAGSVGLWLGSQAGPAAGSWRRGSG